MDPSRQAQLKLYTVYSRKNDYATLGWKKVPKEGNLILPGADGLVEPVGGLLRQPEPLLADVEGQLGQAFLANGLEGEEPSERIRIRCI